jgi:hypothetical protein
MSSKKIGQSREVFLDFTMNDDNNLLEQINEIEKNFGLNISGEGNKVTHAKVSMPKSETGKNSLTHSGSASNAMSASSTGGFSLDELVKETEGLIETISETVQETAKISSHTSEIDWTVPTPTERPASDWSPASILTDDEEVQQLETIEATDEDAAHDDAPYTPHFIAEELGRGPALQQQLDVDDKTPQVEPKVFSSAHLFDDDLESESDVLHQTGSFLFNTKELHFAANESEADNVDLRPQPQAEGEMNKITEATDEHVHATTHIDETDASDDLLEHMPADETAEHQIDLVSDALFDTPSFDSSGEKTPTDTVLTSDNLFESDEEDQVESTIVAKLEDIDVLLQKLDDLSMKEMVSTLASNGQTRKDTARKRDLTLDMLLEEQTPDVVTEGEESNSHEASATWVPRATTETNDARVRETGEVVAETHAGQNNQAEIEVDTDANGQDQLNVDLFTPQMHEPKARDVRLEEAMVQTLAKAQKTEQSQRPALKTPAMAHPTVSEQAALLTKKDDVYKTRDLIDTQPINLREIEKMNTQSSRVGREDTASVEQTESSQTPALSVQHQDHSQNELEKEQIDNVTPLAHNDVSPAVDNGHGLTENGTTEAAVQESNNGIREEAANIAESTVAEHNTLTVDVAAPDHPSLASADAVRTRTVEPSEVHVAHKLDTNGHGTALMENQDDALVKAHTTEQASIHQTQAIDISQFSDSFEHTFAQANASQQLVDNRMQTDELMNLHEKMMQAEHNNDTLHAKATAQRTNAAQFNFADVLKEAEAMQELSDDRLVRDTVLPTLNQPTPSTESGRQEQVVTNTLPFIESTDVQHELQGKSMEVFPGLDEFEALARRTEQKVRKNTALSEARNELETHSVHNTSVHAEQQTIADTGTTLINLSVVDVAGGSNADMRAQPTAVKQPSEPNQLPISRSEVNTQTETGVDKKTRNMLLVTVVGLSIVILALVVIIIFQLIM